MQESIMCCAGHIALALGELLLASLGLCRLGSEEWAGCCEHSQAGLWLPSLRGTSDVNPFPCPQEVSELSGLLP